jgi:predicted NBD/HSP70 family sugar kinase
LFFRNIKLTLLDKCKDLMEINLLTQSLKQSLLNKEILKHLYYRGSLSLTELSRLTKKSLPVVTTVVASMVEAGYLIDKGLAPSTGGRRASKFSINSKIDHYLVAVGMDQFVTRIAVFNLSNELVVPVKTLHLDINSDSDALGKLTSFINTFFSESGIDKSKLLGLGLCMPGFVNAKEGINHSYFLIENGNLRDYLSEQLSVPVFIDNDSSAIALAELHFGAARGMKEVMVVNMGWGIGLGMIINGSLFRGHNGYAGELSHIPLSKSDNLCFCGKRGCLEVDASLLVIAEKAKEALKDGAKSKLREYFTLNEKLPAEYLLQAAQEGDQLAISLLSEATFTVGKGIATLIHIMNPQRIVISGRGAEAGRILLAPINQALNEYCIQRLFENTEIVVSDLAHGADLIGAATLVIENFNFK